MREIFYITGLMAAISLLALDFPVGVSGLVHEVRANPPFASYVELSPSVHAACLETAKTSWQVRSGSRGRPVIGSLDSGVPLLTDALPPMTKVVFREIGDGDSPLGPIDTDVYSLMPGTEGSDIPSFAVRPQDVKDAGGNRAGFTKDDMLSVENFRKLKEIMQ